MRFKQNPLRFGYRFFMRKQNPDFRGENSDLAIHWKTRMNATFLDKRIGSETNDIHFPFKSLIAYNRSSYVKPIMWITYEIYVPVINDSHYQLDANGLLAYFFTTLMIILLLKACKMLGNLNDRTWAPLIAIKMLLGLENPQNPVGFGESLLFLFISIAGIFFSNEFYESVTCILIPIKVERKLQTFEDLKANNITVMLEQDPTDMRAYGGQAADSLILMSKINYEKAHAIKRYTEGVTEMVRFQNKSVSIAKGLECTTSNFDSTIYALGKPRAKTSSMIEYTKLLTYYVDNFSPFNERISDLLWRFYECGFSFGAGYKQAAFVLYEKYRDKEIYDETRLEHDDIEDDFTITYLLVFILVCGSTLSIVLLLCEILHFKCKPYLRRMNTIFV